MKKILLHYEIKKHEVLLYFEQETLSIHPSAFLKFQRELKQPIDSIKLKHLLDHHMYYQALDKALKYLNRPRTIHEIKDHLSRQTRSDIIDQIVHHLKNHGYLDDQKFIEHYIDAHPLYGPKLISLKLKNKGIHEEVLKPLLNSYHWTERLNNVLKKSQSLTQKSSFKAQQQKIYRYGLLKGFDRKDIQLWMTQNLNLNDEDEWMALKKLYERTFDKIFRQSNENACQKWISKAVSKGFSYTKAKALCEEKLYETMD